MKSVNFLYCSTVGLILIKDTGGDSGALALEISNLGGVFLVFIVGSFFGIFVALLELVNGVKQRCAENNVSLRNFRNQPSNPCYSISISSGNVNYLMIGFV